MKFAHLLHSQQGITFEFKRDLSSPANIMKTLDEEGRLNNIIADSISPSLSPNIEIIPSKHLTLLAVEVFPCQLRSYYLKQKSEQQGVFVRLPKFMLVCPLSFLEISTEI